MTHNSHPLLQECVNSCPLPFPCSICNIVYTFSGLKSMISCQVLPNSSKRTVIQLLFKLPLAHICWQFTSDISARTCQSIDAKTFYSRFLPLMHNKLTDDVRTRFRENVISGLGHLTPICQGTPTTSHKSLNKKGPNRELNPGPLPVLRAPLRVSKLSRREYNTTILLGRKLVNRWPIEILIQCYPLGSPLRHKREILLLLSWELQNL